MARCSLSGYRPGVSPEARKTIHLLGLQCDRSCCSLGLYGCLHKFRISRFLKFRPTSPRMFLILLFSLSRINVPKASVTRSGKLTPFSPSAVSSRLTATWSFKYTGLRVEAMESWLLSMRQRSRWSCFLSYGWTLRRTSSFNFGKVNPKSGSTDLMSF